jgi:hypothetical protein
MALPPDYQGSFVKPRGESYRATVAVVAAGAGLAVEIAGSATKTIEVVQCIVAKPSVDVTIELKKTSTVATGGTSAATVATPLDSQNAAATASVRAFSGVPTPGSAVGSGLMIATECKTTEVIYEDYLRRGISGVVLRGVAEGFALHVGAAATVRVTLEWIER